MDKEVSSPSWRCARCLKLKYSPKCSAQNYCIELTMFFLSPPIWRPENRVKHWLSSRLIFWTEPKNFYKSTFPNTLTPKRPQYKNHEISVHFSTNAILAFTSRFKIQNVLIYKQRTLLNWNVVNSPGERQFWKKREQWITSRTITWSPWRWAFSKH